MHATMRRDTVQDAAARRRYKPPLLPILCTHDHLSPLYSLDTAASPRTPCTCLETTPPSAIAVGTPHGHGMITSNPDPLLMCQHAPDDRHGAVNATLPSPCPFEAQKATSTVRLRDTSALTLSL